MSLLVLSAVALVCCASPQPTGAQPLRAQVAPYQLEVLVHGSPAHTYNFQGESYVLGQEGSRYLLRVHNRSDRRVEAVVTVDGLDVIDGRPGDYANKRGYLIEAYGYVDIDGWRLSNREAAAFRFAPIGASYAAKTGSARNVGVIGVAVFPERVRPRPVYTPKTDYERSADSRQGAGFAESAHEQPRTQSADVQPAAPSSSSAPAAAARAEAKSTRRERSGLGTEFGEAVSSTISHVAFVRSHATQPSAVFGARYNDRAGLLALGIVLDGPSDLALRQSANPFPRQQHYARPPADWRRD
jgi:hypothetical protein